MKQHRVQPGDCLSSIAYQHGFFWETLWRHSDNAELQRLRENPFTLVAGDVVAIPELTEKVERGRVDERHRFRRRGVPAKLVIRLLDHDGQPRANLDYMLEIDGVLTSTDKQTDGDGVLRETISPSATQARLYLADGSETYEIELGRLEPVSTVRGLQARLQSLGFHVGKIDGVDIEHNPALADAIERFCLAHDLDPATDLETIRAAIASAHDG